MSAVRVPWILVAALLLTLPLVTPKIRGADEIEYFAYLHSAVFDRDLDFENEYTHFYAQDPVGLAGFKATFLDLREPTGRPINFAPMGTALLWAPAYLLAHTGVVRSAEGTRQAELPYFYLERYTASYVHEWEAFVAALVAGETPPVTAADARAPLVIGLAAWRSLREGRPVRVDEVAA